MSEVCANKLLETKLKQKAKWVARRYPELLENDLIQEGLELICKLRNIKGKNISIHYLLKALSFHFSNIMRATNQKHNISMQNINFQGEDLSVKKEFEELEKRFDREKFIKYIENNNLLFILSGLMNGDKIKEIAKRNNISVRTIYRHIKTLKKLREVWEK